MSSRSHPTKSLKPFDSFWDKWKSWVIVLSLRVTLKLLEYIVKVLISLCTIINHHYINLHNTLAQITISFYLILLLLECYDSFNYTLSTLLVREFIYTWWYCWDCNRFVTLDLDSLQKVIYSLTKNFNALLSFAFFENRTDYISNFFTFLV